MPMVQNTIAPMSIALPLYSAASTPIGMPITSATTTATAPTRAETGKCWEMMELTVVSCFL